MAYRRYLLCDDCHKKQPCRTHKIFRWNGRCGSCGKDGPWKECDLPWELSYLPLQYETPYNVKNLAPVTRGDR